MPDPTGDFINSLKSLLDDKGEKNYDPRMEELMRSDRLIDPKYENMSVLEDPEIFHISKLRGAQVGFRLPVSRIKKIYDLPEMQGFHAPWIDYTRSLDSSNPDDKKILDSDVGGLPMVTEMLAQLVTLRPAKEGARAKLYADSIKPQVANLPPIQPVQEEQEGFFSKIAGFLFGKKSNNNYNDRRN